MKGVIFIRKQLILGAILALLFSFQTAYAMPSYGFGVTGNENSAVHIEENTVSPRNTNNHEAIHIDISAMGTVLQKIPKNSERIGTLTIPSGRKIGVFAGESITSMGKGAAHFSDTGLNFSNTVLIGHNRGSAGYFIFVKDLQIGQVLTLETNDITKKYVVAEMHKVHATDTELLMHSGDSRLTLVTCWENQKDYRRAIVAYEEVN